MSNELRNKTKPPQPAGGIRFVLDTLGMVHPEAKLEVVIILQEITLNFDPVKYHRDSDASR